MLDDLLDVSFPLSCQTGDVELPFPCEAVDDLALAERADDNRSRSDRRSRDQLSAIAPDAGEIALQIGEGMHHSGIEMSVCNDRNRTAIGDQRHAAWRCFPAYGRRTATGPRVRRGGRGEEQEKEEKTTPHADHSFVWRARQDSNPRPQA